MQAKRKLFIVFMVIIMVGGQLLADIKGAGKLLIPTADGKIRPYKGVIIITQSGVSIECREKIFQPLNEFDTPRQARIVVNTVEVKEIQVQIQEKKIFIITNDSFTTRYRSLFNRTSRIIRFNLLYPIEEKNWALIFDVDNPADIKAIGEALLKIIGERCDVRN